MKEWIVCYSDVNFIQEDEHHGFDDTKTIHKAPFLGNWIEAGFVFLENIPFCFLFYRVMCFLVVGQTPVAACSSPETINMNQFSKQFAAQEEKIGRESVYH